MSTTETAAVYATVVYENPRLKRFGWILFALPAFMLVAQLLLAVLLGASAQLLMRILPLFVGAMCALALAAYFAVRMVGMQRLTVSPEEITIGRMARPPLRISVANVRGVSVRKSGQYHQTYLDTVDGEVPIPVFNQREEITAHVQAVINKKRGLQ